MLLLFNLEGKTIAIVDTFRTLSNYIYFDREEMWVLTRQGICKGRIKDIMREVEKSTSI